MGTAGKSACWIKDVEGAKLVRKGEKCEIWVTGEGAEEMEGTAETNLAVEGVKGAVAMI